MPGTGRFSPATTTVAAPPEGKNGVWTRYHHRREGVCRCPAGQKIPPHLRDLPRYRVYWGDTGHSKLHLRRLLPGHSPDDLRRLPADGRDSLDPRRDTRDCRRLRPHLRGA